MIETTERERREQEQQKIAAQQPREEGERVEQEQQKIVEEQKALAVVQAGVAAEQGEWGGQFASTGQAEIDRFLQVNGNDVKVANEDGYTLLHLAIRENNGIDVVQFLVSEGADIHAQDQKNGATPLQWAAYKGNLEVAKFLVAEGADIYTQNTMVLPHSIRQQSKAMSKLSNFSSPKEQMLMQKVTAVKLRSMWRYLLELVS